MLNYKIEYIKFELIYYEGLTLKNSDILIIIPAYNEAENIELVVDNLTYNYQCYDYIVINDGSSDNTLDICKQNGYNYLDLPMNLGLAGAIRSGFRYAYSLGYKYVVQIDGDNQHDPCYISNMLDYMQEHNDDIVIGSRFVNKRKSRSIRMFGSNLIEVSMWITTGKRIKDVTSGMRLYNARMIEAFGYRANFGPEPDTIAFLINCGARIDEIQVEMRDRVNGVSYLSFTKSIKYMIHMLYGILVFQWLRKKGKL